MARENSVLAYRQIRECGLLGERLFEVYDCLYSVGRPMTHGELGEILKSRLERAGISLSTARLRNVSARLCELVKLGACDEIESRTCAVSGKRAMAYDISGRLPEKKKLSDAELLDTQLARCEKAWEKFEAEQEKLRLIAEQLGVA